MATREPALRIGAPLWVQPDRQRRRQRYPALNGHRDVELAIVGGGFTGAVVAEAFTNAGMSVALLEGQLAGRGSTAASSALLLQEPDHGIAQLSKRHGAESAQRIWQLGRDAVATLIDTLTRLEIACDLERRDTIYVASRDDQARLLDDELRRRENAGFHADPLNASQVAAITGLTAIRGARTHGNAQLDPCKATIGLLAAAAANGAQIFERSPVSRIERHGRGVRLHTKHARLDARRVIVATGYATDRFRPLVGRFRMFRTYVLATARLSARERRAIGFDNVMMWDTERPYHYARWTSDRRLLLGGGERRVRPGQRRGAEFTRATASLRQDFEAMLPSLRGIEIAHAWEGLFALTPDSLPYIGSHRRYPRHLFALGYGGNGMAYAPLAARILLEHYRGTHSRDHELFAFGRFRR